MIGCCVHVLAVSIISAVSVDNGVVQWSISSSLPRECYGSYSLRLSRCTIQALAILPAVNLSDDAIRAIFAGQQLLVVTLFDFCVLIIIHFISPGIFAATLPTSMTAVNSTSYESVDIGDCGRPTLRTSISLASKSGRLVLSSANNDASTYECNISLGSEGVASTCSLVTSCSAAGELWLYRREHAMLLYLSICNRCQMKYIPR